jgi:hypothetical protein
LLLLKLIPKPSHNVQTQSGLIELMCTMHPPDFVVMPTLEEDFELYDFGRLDEAFEVGYRDTLRALEGLSREIGSHN